MKFISIICDYCSRARYVIVTHSRASWHWHEKSVAISLWIWRPSNGLNFFSILCSCCFPHHKPASTRGRRHIPRQRISLKPSLYSLEIFFDTNNFDFTDKREETSHKKILLCFSTVRLRLCLTRPTERFWHTESFCLRWERRKKSALCAHITSSPNNLLCARRRRSHEKSTLFVSARLCRWDSFFFGLRFWAIFPLF